MTQDALMHRKHRRGAQRESSQSRGSVIARAKSANATTTVNYHSTLQTWRTPSQCLLGRSSKTKTTISKDELFWNQRYLMSSMHWVVTKEGCIVSETKRMDV